MAQSIARVLCRHLLSSKYLWKENFFTTHAGVECTGYVYADNGVLRVEVVLWDFCVCGTIFFG